MAFTHVFLLGLALAVCGAAGQTTQAFIASIDIYNDPNMLGGVTGSIVYNYTKKMQKIEYLIGDPANTYTKVIEIIDFESQLRYLKCKDCEAETYRKSAPQYFLTASETQLPSTLGLGLPDSIVVGSESCSGKVKAASAQGEGEVFVVYVQNADPNKVCRVIFDNPEQAGTTNVGKYIDFKGVSAIPFFITFDDYKTWNCPTPSCAVRLDLYLVFDESTSIDPAGFGQEKQFGNDIVSSYTIGPDTVRVGMTVFGTTGRIWFNLTDDARTVFDFISSLGQQGGATCIPCGIELARDGLDRDARPGVGRVIIAVTDGQNNVRTDELNSTIDSIANRGIIMFGIGVTNSVSPAEIAALGYNIQGRYYLQPDFASLSSILDSLISETCVELPGNPCGQGCRGFCSCEQTCLCPTKCVSANQCLEGICRDGGNGNGCLFSNKTCDSNPCLIDSCDPISGCSTVEKNCADSNPCTADTCDPSTGGCQNTPLICDDKNPCTRDICNVTTAGCDNSTRVPCALCTGSPNPQPDCVSDECTQRQCAESANGTTWCEIISTTNCNDSNICSDDICVVGVGCVYTKKVCDDGDPCTRDYCDPNVVGGCTNSSIAFKCNVAADEQCFIGSCNSSYTGNGTAPYGPCVYTPIRTCNSTTCAVGVCDSVFGCIEQKRPCNSEVVALKDACHYAKCEENIGCREFAIPDAQRSTCGVCQGAEEDCPAPPVQTEVVAGISAGILLLLILGGIAICLALAAIGGKKGYDAYINGKEAGMNAEASPYYEGGNMAGENPYFDDQ